MENKEVIQPQTKKSKTKLILSILFLITMIVITFVLIFTKYDIKILFELLKEVNLIYVFIAVAMMFVYIFFEGMATKKILKSLGYKTSIGENFLYASVDFYFCAITPSATGGQPMVAYYMKKDDIPVSASSLALLLNTAIFKIVLIVLSGLSLIFCHQIIANSVLAIVLVIVGFVINIALVTFCLLCAFKRKWVEAAGKRIIMLLVRMKICKKPYKLMRSFIKKMDDYEQGALIMKKNKSMFIKAFIYNFIQRIAMFSMAYFVYLAFKCGYPELKNYSFFVLFGIQALISISVDSLPFPGGMGISEWLYILILEFVYGGILSHKGDDLVASAMLLTRAVSFYIPLIVCSIIFIVKHVLTMIKSKTPIRRRNRK